MATEIKHDVIIIGGGAAGLMCAIEAGKRGRTCLVIEHEERVGKKISISGGGRCNFTNINTTSENFISSNPNFCKSALARYKPSDFILLVEKHGIKYHEKKLGQLFCDRSSQQIIEMLLKECELARAEIRLNCEVKEIVKSNHFTLNTNQGTFQAESLVIASGGLSIPKIGATNFGYRVAKQFGLNIIDTRPALVPLTFGLDQQKEFNELSGISIDSIVSCGKAEFRENVLITHRGISGPAILQISSYWRAGDLIDVNLLPANNAYDLFVSHHGSNMDISSLLGFHLPKRFIKKWCDLYIKSQPINRYSSNELKEIADLLHHWQLRPNGTEGYKKAEVTLGGVDTDELSSKTMESKKVRGLYFIGEVVDVTGHLGGYNFQWAWASGFAAGQFV
jgi:predicted Rossmann fold flavoprotein